MNSITILNAKYSLSLDNATVIHVNKYSQAYGGEFNFPVSSRLYTETVFRLSETGEDIRLVIQYLDLPVYTNQDVTLLV